MNPRSLSFSNSEMMCTTTQNALQPSVAMSTTARPLSELAQRLSGITEDNRERMLVFACKTENVDLARALYELGTHNTAVFMLGLKWRIPYLDFLRRCSGHASWSIACSCTK